MKDIHEQIEEIASLLKNDPARENLKKLNDLIENDDEVIKLSEELKRLEREYSSLLNHEEETSTEAKKKQKELFEAKKRLDSHPLVQQYYQCLQEVNEPLHYLEYQLLNRITKPYSSSDCSSK
ncbi:MAG: YlbF family regulator [Bacilli bacterium]